MDDDGDVPISDLDDLDDRDDRDDRDDADGDPGNDDNGDGVGCVFFFIPGMYFQMLLLSNSFNCDSMSVPAYFSISSPNSLCNDMNNSSLCHSTGSNPMNNVHMMKFNLFLLTQAINFLINSLDPVNTAWCINVSRSCCALSH